jgi:hypothetical protein
VAKDRDIKYAEYDYGQPESEKNGLLIRSRSGDNRVAVLVLGAFALILLIGAIFSIPSVRDFLEGRKNTAEIAFGVEYFEGDACFSRTLNLAALHADSPLNNATSIDVTVILLTASKGELARATETIDLTTVDWTNPPAPWISIQPELPERQNESRASQCQVQVRINE